MRIIDNISELGEVKKGCVLTIGNFDGVHMGHQVILTAAQKSAGQRKTELVAMTFDPHPVAILHSQKAPGVLTPLKLKEHLLAESGVDTTLVLKSSPELLTLSPHDFVQRFLVENIQPSVVVEGESFNFGYRRTGDIHTLQQLGAEKGFGVSVISAKEVNLSTGQTAKVSSTMIRNMLEGGGLADAAVALGRPYRLIGRMVPGCGKGKQLGFPTANIEPTRQIIPAEGVYAGFVQMGDSEEEVCPTKEKIPAALSIGRAETLGSDNTRAIEAHILTDDVGDLSGKWLAVDFIKHLRNQKKFKSEKELSAQIAKDCKKAKKILAQIVKYSGSSIMNYEFELVEVKGPNLFQGEYDPSDKWHWVRFVFNCITGQKSVRVPTQVMIPNLAYCTWAETSQEIQKRAYAFLRRNFQSVFRNKLKNGLDGFQKELESGTPIPFKITSLDEATEKLDVKKNDRFIIQV